MFKSLLEVLMAENTRIMEFRVVTPSLLDGYGRFVGKCCHLIQRKLGCRRHPRSTLHTKASSEASFTCKSSLLPLGNSFCNFLSLFHWNLQLTVHSGNWWQRICSSAGICDLHHLCHIRGRITRSMLHPDAGIFVLWTNNPWQACLESFTEMFLKENSIKHVCRRWFEWQASTRNLISKRLSAVVHNCMTLQGRLI